MDKCWFVVFSGSADWNGHFYEDKDKDKFLLVLDTHELGYRSYVHLRFQTPQQEQRPEPCRAYQRDNLELNPSHWSWHINVHGWRENGWRSVPSPISLGEVTVGRKRKANGKQGQREKLNPGLWWISFRSSSDEERKEDKQTERPNTDVQRSKTAL